MKDYKVNPERAAIKRKNAQIEEVVKTSGDYSTLAMMDLRKLPDALFQSLRKKIRDEGGKVRVVRKAVAERALDKLGKKLAEKKDECDKPVAFVFTNLSPYNLHRFFQENYRKRAAKTGDVAPYDIIVPAGETDLPPGPALSELKSGGVNVQIKGGKIVVAKDSTVAKEGDRITVMKVKALQKLNILPFESRASMVFAFDGSYVYGSDVLASADNALTDIQASFRDAVNLSLNANYPTPSNIDMLLVKAVQQSLNFALNGELYSSSSIELLLSSAARQGLALESAVPAEPSAPTEGEAEKKEEKKPEETKTEEKKPEEKKPEEAKPEEKKEVKK